MNDKQSWINLGEEIKNAERWLQKIISDKEYSSILNKEIMHELVNAVNSIGKFKSKAEDRMLEKGYFKDDKEYDKVFYHNSDDKYTKNLEKLREIALQEQI